MKLLVHHCYQFYTKMPGQTPFEASDNESGFTMQPYDDKHLNAYFECLFTQVLQSEGLKEALVTVGSEGTKNFDPVYTKLVHWCFEGHGRGAP